MIILLYISIILCAGPVSLRFLVCLLCYCLLYMPSRNLLCTYTDLLLVFTVLFCTYTDLLLVFTVLFCHRCCGDNIVLF